MEIGISSACFYPLVTEKALETLGKGGIKTCEVFINTISETTPQFAKELNKIKNEYGINIVSVHPFSSFAETHMIFCNYERRSNDALDFYKRTFEVTALLGADISVIHGSKKSGSFSDEQYFEKFHKLIETGKEFSVRVCQENVNNYYSENPSFLRKMRSALGDDFNMVFDVKQAVRAGYNPLEIAEEFKESIAHVHLSDHSDGGDCLPPFRGCFDYASLFSILDSVNYNGNCVIELYRKNYSDNDELFEAYNKLLNFRNCLQK